MSQELNLSELADRLRQQTTLNEPFLGALTSVEAEQRSTFWPTNGQWRAVELRQRTTAGERQIDELTYHPVAADAEPLIVIIVWDSGTAHPGARLYSMHSLVKTRPPMLPEDPSLHPGAGPGDPVGRYLAAIAKGDVETVLPVFEPTAYFLHSEGHTYRGHEGLREDFTRMFTTGGVKLRYCTLNDDGTTCALEVILANGRPAVVLYGRGTQGLLASVRIAL